MLAGAKITTEQILTERRERIPWTGKEDVVRDQGVRQGKGTSELDRSRNERVIISDLGILVLAILVLGLTLAYLGSNLVVTWDPEGKRGWGSGRV